MQMSRAMLSLGQVSALTEHFGSPECIWSADENEIRTVLNRAPEAAGRLIDIRKDCPDPDRIHAEYARVDSLGIGYVCFFDNDYPEKLRNIPNPPLGLFYLGRLPDSDTPAIAIVGSRDCSNYGKSVAIDLSRKLAGSGIDIISGMAAGIDGFSHRGALNGGGDTFAVLGCGVDICYPAVNRDIYARIRDHGGIISEYYPSTQPLSYNFPMRNRLISGLSDGILVVEARQRSGSWITVDFGLEQGKEIYAVPGRIGDRLSAGCNNLIRNGARLVTGPEDIIRDLGQLYAGKIASQNAEAANRRNGISNTPEEKILSELDLTGRSIDDICAATGMGAAEVTRVLTLLEIRGKCTRIGTAVYALKV